MGSSADRAAVLVQAIEASVAGDSRVVRDLYSDDVHGWSPVMTVSSAAELAVELEDRQEAFSDIELEASAALSSPRLKLRSPAASSIVVPPVMPSIVAPSSSSVSRSPLTTKPPGA